MDGGNETVSIPFRPRLPGADAFRCAMVLAVVALHASMTYMRFAPQWWYVVDGDGSLLFTGAVVILDMFPMTALFLLSGYFAPASLAKNGTWAFVRSKLLRLGMPWLLGVTLVAPVLARMSMRRYGLPDTTLSAFIREDFFGVWYQQGPFWFLGVLLCFMLLFAALTAIFKRVAAPRKGPKPSGILVAGALFATLLAHACWLAATGSADSWLSLAYILYFQPARLAGYAVAFALGAYAGAGDWFGNGWRPGTVFWGILSIASLAARIVWSFSGAPAYPGIPNIVLESATYAVAAWSTTLFLLAAFLRAGEGADRLLRPVSPYSFWVYWWHQPVFLTIATLLLPLGVSPYIKCPAAILVTVAVSGLPGALARWTARQLSGRRTPPSRQPRR